MIDTGWFYVIAIICHVVSKKFSTPAKSDAEKGHACGSLVTMASDLRRSLPENGPIVSLYSPIVHGYFVRKWAFIFWASKLRSFQLPQPRRVRRNWPRG